MEKKLAIFDLDGTLFNTDDVNYFAYKEAVKPFGAELDRLFFVEKCNGRHYKQFVPIILGSEEHMEEVHEAKKKHYREFLGNARPNTHLFELIKLMRPAYKTAIVTTASRKNVEDILDCFNVKGLFDDIITQEDIKKPKPDPEGFCLAMERAGVTPEETFIFEDSDVGIEAARRSKATVFVADTF